MKKILFKPLDFLIFMIKDIERTDFWGICAQMSFYILMSFFPLVIFLINFVGRFIIPFKSYLFDLLKRYLPQLSYDYVYNLIESLSASIGDNHYFLIILTFFFATLAARAVMVGMNQNYGNPETRSPLKIWLLSFLFTLLFAISIILIIIAYFLSEFIGAALFTSLGIDDSYLSLMDLVTFIFSFFVSIVLFNFVYILAPDKRLKLYHGLPGALFSSLGLNIGLRVFLEIMNQSSKYTTLYGNFGGLFALLVVIYFICVILNLGGKINVFFSR